MKKLTIGAICLLLISTAGTAFAVDDATVQAIGNKAANANAKADGNNSRIQGIEADVVDLQNQIDNIQLNQGLAGKQCSPGEVLVGFDIEGMLICENITTILPPEVDVCDDPSIITPWIYDIIPTEVLSCSICRKRKTRS